MMGRSLLIVGGFATLGLLGSAIVAYMGQPFIVHVGVALLASLLLLFSHCWIMFYLIGTGKAIKEAVAEHDMDQNLIEETKVYKNRSYPWMMLAMGFAMATFILGGGVYTGAIPDWVHHALFWITLVVQVRTLWIELEVLTANERLMGGINAQLQA